MNRIAGLGAVLVHQPRLGRDCQAVSRSAGTEINVFRETGTLEILVGPQPTSFIGPETHQSASQSRNLYRRAARESFCMVISFASVMKRAKLENCCPESS